MRYDNNIMIMMKSVAVEYTYTLSWRQYYDQASKVISSRQRAVPVAAPRVLFFLSKVLAAKWRGESRKQFTGGDFGCEKRERVFGEDLFER